MIYRQTVYLIVKVTMDAHLRFRLPLEKGVMQLLVVDVDLPHLRPDPLPHLGLERLLVLLLLQCLPHFHDAGCLDEFWQIERRLFDAALALEVLPLEAPVTWNGHRVPCRLHVCASIDS